MEQNNQDNIQILLEYSLNEWNQTIEEAKIYFEGEKEIIKQTILVSLTSFIGFIYFVSSKALSYNEMLSFSPAFLIIITGYLFLSIYSFYQTYYRFMISKYWIEELFPKIENLLKLSSDDGQIWKLITSNYKSSLRFLRYQLHYRENLKFQYLIAIFLYRVTPVFFGLISSILYFFFLIKFSNREYLTKYIPFTIQITLGILFIISFFILLYILIWGIISMKKQAYNNFNNKNNL